MSTALFRLILACTLLVGASVPPGAMAAPSVLVERIVAVVDNEPITASALAERVARIKRQFARDGQKLPPDDVLERQVLEQLIVERAQVERASDTGLRIDDDELGRAIGRIAASNNMKVDAFRTALENDGVSWQTFRDNIRQEMLIARLREREVDGRVVVTDAEIDNYLRSNTGADSGQEYRLAHILLRAPESASPEQLQLLEQQVQSLRDRAQAGEDFAALAAEYSNAPEALQGGDLGWRPTDSIPTLFVEALSALAPGQLSPVLRSPAGFHLLKMVDRRGASNEAGAVPQTRVSHILVKTSALVSDDEARQRLETLRTRILNGESLAALARANSADLSAAKGGEIGWVYPGDTVPEFERVMEQLQPGQLSEPVKTPFGWHLIRVEERRTQDVSDDRKRALARNALRKRKSDEAYDDWLRQLRDSVFVEYRLDDIN